MAQPMQLNRKTWTAVFIAAALLLAGPFFLLTRYVASTMQEGGQQIVHPVVDNIVMLRDGSTMLVEKKSKLGRILDSLRRDVADKHVLEIDDSAFLPGTTTVTRAGLGHEIQLARLLKAYPDVSTIILFSRDHGVAPTLQLEHLRAESIQAQLLKLGVDADRLAVGPEAFEAGHRPADEPGLKIVLTNASG